MATLNTSIPDDKHDRIKQLALFRGISVNKLIEELSTIALVEFDTYNRFKAMQMMGSPERGIALLDKLDALTES
jgi:hypothetical protein